MFCHCSAAVEEHDFVGEGHGFDLVVGDVDDAGADFGVQAAEFLAHLYAQGGVKVRERFVEEEDFGVAHEGAADGDALALAAAERFGFSIEVIFELQQARGGADAAVDLSRRDFGELEAEAHVFVNAHVRVERVRLEDHGDFALGWRDFVDAIAVYEDFSRAYFFEAGDHAQQGRFAATRGPEEDAEFSSFYAEVDRVDDLGCVEVFVDVAKIDGGHGRWSFVYVVVWVCAPL